MAMNKAQRAALYSTIIFPGAGLWWLKHYWRACIFVTPAGLALWYITSSIWHVATSIRDRIIDQSIPLDIYDLTRSSNMITQAAEKMMAEQYPYLQTVEYLLLICWLCSIASSYFAGKKIDISEAVEK